MQLNQEIFIGYNINYQFRYEQLNPLGLVLERNSQHFSEPYYDNNFDICYKNYDNYIKEINKKIKKTLDEIQSS